MKITIDVSKLRQAIKSRNVAFLRAVRANWAKSALGFISKIQTTQMSGRPGLRVISGLLRNSWHQNTVVISGKDVNSRIYTSVRYARVHEYGSPSKEIPAIIIPPRQQILHMKTVRTRHGLFGMKPGGNRFIKTPRPATSATTARNYRSKLVNMKAHQIKIPQRLHVRDAWRQEGLKEYTVGLAEALKSYERNAL